MLWLNAESQAFVNTVSVRQHTDDQPAFYVIVYAIFIKFLASDCQKYIPFRFREGFRAFPAAVKKPDIPVYAYIFPFNPKIRHFNPIDRAYYIFSNFRGIWMGGVNDGGKSTVFDQITNTVPVYSSRKHSRKRIFIKHSFAVIRSDAERIFYF